MSDPRGSGRNGSGAGGNGSGAGGNGSGPEGMSGRLRELGERVSAARSETEARGETFYPGPSRAQLAAFPPRERWDDWVELDSKA